MGHPPWMEDENRTPPCRQGNGRAPLSSPKQGDLSGNICLLTVPDHSQNTVCSALRLCRSSAFITNSLMNLWPLAATNYTGHKSVYVKVPTECDQT